MSPTTMKADNKLIMAQFIAQRVALGQSKEQILAAAKTWYGHLYTDEHIITDINIQMAMHVQIQSERAIAQAKEEHSPFTAPFVAVYGYNDPASMWELYLVLTNRMVLRAPEGIEEIISDGRRLVLSDKLEFADTLAD
jgi:hypothetical protein